MKTTFTLFLLFAAAVATAQTKSSLPLSDFTIDLSESSIISKPGDRKQIAVSITRSKHYAKGKVILELSSILPKGITILFEPTEGNPDINTAIIKVGPDADQGIYQLVVSATLNHKKVGTILKVAVNNEQVAIK